MSKMSINPALQTSAEKPQKLQSPWAVEPEARRRKREAVLFTAAQLFNERGFHNTSLDDVAERLGVTKPTLYRYVANKEEILFECVRIGLATLVDAAESVAGAGNGATRLTAFMRRHAEIMTEDFGRIIARVSDRELSADSRLRLRGLKREIDQQLRLLVTDGVADGSIAAIDPALAAAMIAGALNGIAWWYDPAGKQTPAELGENCARQLMAGLAPRPDEAQKTE